MKNNLLRGYLLLGTAVSLVTLSPAFAQESTIDETPTEETRELQTVIVRGEFIPEPQRETSQVATFLAPEDLQRQGDSNAALALTRLSGLSVVGDRFVYVRGLGDRYSSALLNGSPLPSPEPLRRTVPLDIFPSSVLNGATIQKTYSVNYPGEFGGGVIDLQTIKQPNENFLNLKVGIGANTVTTGEDGIFVRGSDTDGLGYDDGLRDIPGALSSALAAGPLLGQSDDVIEAAGESLVNSPLTVIQSEELDPNYNGSIEFGRIFDGPDYEIGVIGVAGFDSGWSTKESLRSLSIDNNVVSPKNTLETTYNATTNALGSVTLNWAGSQELQATALYIHDTSKEAQIDTGQDESRQGSTGEIFDESTGWFERELLFGQLRGEHGFDNLVFSWRGSISQSTRDAPYERKLTRQPDADGTPLYSVPNSYRLRFSELTDESYGVGADAAYTIGLSDSRKAVLTGGFDIKSTERQYDFLSFFFGGGNALPLDVQQARPDFLFSPDNIDPARFVLRELVSADDSYAGQLDVNAFFAQADIELTDFIEITVGARYEEAEQTINTFNRFGDPGAGDVDLQNDYVLPAATLTWNFADDLQFRLGYSETIARPQFRELAQSAYLDTEIDLVYRGNRKLVDSELTNYDARLEYYLGRSEFVTLAAFYKDITNPIEETVVVLGDNSYTITVINAPKAVLFGGEVEYRTRFDLPLPGSFFGDREGLFSINYTYTNSEVQADETDVIFDPIGNVERSADFYAIDGNQLQGSSENILNVQLGWESDVEQLTLLAGWVDDRILRRGNVRIPDVIESPGVQLDLVYNRDIEVSDRVFTLGLRARNLLDEDYEEFQETPDVGRSEFNTYERGISFSASLSAEF